MRRRLALVRGIQRNLERYYALERAPDAAAFVSEAAGAGRERLLVRQIDDTLELRLELPALDDDAEIAGDGLLQVLEGVSHFVYLAERARRELPATQLELELQAEVDKFVLLGLARERADAARTRWLRERLYEEVRFLHPPGSEQGDRYRLANRLAARLVGRVAELGCLEARRALRAFYGMGLSEKLRLARAA
jgi:hypothetical protein